MQKPVTPSWTHHLPWRRLRAARRPEAADLGTELGMEHWLDEARTEPPRQRAEPLRRSWLKRWLPRLSAP